MRVSPHYAHAREILLSARRYVGEHRLYPLEALVNAAPEILNNNADNRQGQKSIHRKSRADVPHEDQGAGGENNGIGRIHDGRRQQHANCVQIIRRPGHDVARAGALIVGIGKPFQVAEEVIAQIEFNLARNADQLPAGKELEDPFGQRH